jgi:serine/threonine-protein kinase RsbT
MVMILIGSREDAVIAQTITRHFASRLGMPLRTAGEFSIAVSEIATNIVRHGTRGSIELLPNEKGISLIAQDEGPGILDVKAALVDGYSKGRMIQADDHARDGLGYGLGAIKRLLDRVEFENLPEGGLCIRAWKYFVRGRTW